MNVLAIAIGRKALDHWPVVATHSRPGDAPVVTAGQLTLDEETLRAQTGPAQYGRMLGEALFSGSIRDAFVRALPASQGERLDVLLDLGDEALRAAVRWEWLCAPTDERWPFLALNSQTPYARYIPRSMGAFFRPLARRDLAALIVAASPSDLADYRLAPFDAAAAAQRVRQSLGDIPARTLADTHAIPSAAGPPTLDGLIGELAHQPAHLLHIVCHGAVSQSGETYLFLAGPDGRVQDVSATTLINRLRLAQGVHGLPHLVFLSACETASPEGEQALGGMAQRMVRELGFPAVVAMTERVSVETALAFSAGFYNALRVHGNPAHALADAGAALAGRSDATVPALFTCLPGQSLFTDDRPLETADVLFGIDVLEGLLPERAPVLLLDELEPDGLGAFSRLARATRQTLPASGSQGVNGQAGWLPLLAELDAIARDALEMPFAALALGKSAATYDASQPFMGMNAFQAGDRRFFFGRRKLVATVAALAESPGLIGVFGPSGCGKSSLVLAGVVPTLQKSSPALRTVTIRPGGSPLSQLDQVLSASGHGTPELPPIGKIGNSLLVVDQFEELFTLVEDEAVQRAFVERLLELSRNLPIILTMRSEFLDDCARYPVFYAALQPKLQHIAPMTGDELSTAIQAQASAANLVFEADLVNTILDDVAGEPGAMPLLQHGLLRLWQRRQGRRLAASEYRKIGGVQEAIAQTAEGVYLRLATDDQVLMRRILLRLVRLDENDVRRDARRREQFDQLLVDEGERAAVSRLVARLADEKLLSTGVNPASGEHEVELAHEALIQHWARLREWIEADRTDLVEKQRIAATAREWQQRNQDSAFLLRGVRLIEAREVAAHYPDFNPTELEFMRRSQRAEGRKRAGILVARISSVAAFCALLFLVFTQQWVFTPQLSLSPVTHFDGVKVSQIAWKDNQTGYVGFDGTWQGSSLARTVDGGQTWEKLDLAGAFVSAIQIDPTEPERVYALLRPIGLFVSENGGDTWRKTTQRLPVRYFNAFSVSPSGVLTIGDNLEANGVHWSMDQGRTWQRIPGSPSTPVNFLTWVDDRLLVGTPIGLWERHTDDTWNTYLTSPPTATLAAAPFRNHLVVAGGQRGSILLDSTGNTNVLSEETTSHVTSIENEDIILIATDDRPALLWQQGKTFRIVDAAAGSFIYQLSSFHSDAQYAWLAREDGLQSARISRWYERIFR